MLALTNCIMVTIGIFVTFACFAYTTVNIVLRLDEQREEVNRNLESNSKAMQSYLFQIDCLKKENAWLRDRLKENHYEHHPAFAMAAQASKQDTRRRRRTTMNEVCTQDMPMPVPLQHTSSPKEGGDEV